MEHYRYPAPYPNMAAMNNTLTTEIISVPDRMVGLIIGKGGEQIAAIQQESDCRIQFAQDANGSPDRQCTLTGSIEALRKAKDLIYRVLNKNDAPSSGPGPQHQQIHHQQHQHQPPPNMMIDGHMMIEMMIPGNKAGIIIGKGGETIKQLQETAGVKMIIIQDSNSPSTYEKPLRITGDHNNCQKARDMVNQLLSDKNGMNNSLSDYSTQLKTTIEIAVPRSMIGIVIGKQGEMIKKIQLESGARIQFRQDDDPNTASRLCTITGNQEQAQTANTTILELINNSKTGGNEWNRNKGSNDSYRSSRSESGKSETTYSVPAEKCGLVIGKGGDSIRDICRNSGAHVELIRDTTSTTERVFRIQGSQEQIQNAIQLISDRAGIVVHSQEINPSPAILSNNALNIANLNGQLSALSIQPQPAAIQHVLPSAYAVPGWSATNQFPTFAQPALAHMPDLSKQSEAVTAWITCYQQLGQQPAATLQPVTKQISPYTALARANITPQPMLNPQTGQLDYSAAWADYYRQQGMYQQAQAIMQTNNLPQQLQ